MALDRSRPRPGSIRRPVPGAAGAARPRPRTTLPAAQEASTPAAGGAVAPAPDAADAAPQTDAGRRGTLRRRARPVRRSSDDGTSGLNPLFIRVGIVLAIVVIGVIARAASGKSSGDLRYWNAAADFSHRVDRATQMTPAQMRSEIKALPIAGVTDPKLREFHQCMVDTVESLARLENNDAELPTFLKLADRMDKLTDELNIKYTGHK